MTIRAVEQLGSSVLRTRARVVRHFNSPDVVSTIRNLTANMRAHNLVGMAAPQIGVGLRIFVTEIRKTTIRKNISKKDGLRVFINPRIVRRSRLTATGYEGCGSVAHADLFGRVVRSKSVEVTAKDAEGKTFTLKATGLLAKVIQHELDHLNGVVFLDRVKDTRTLVDRATHISNA